METLIGQNAGDGTTREACSPEGKKPRTPKSQPHSGAHGMTPSPPPTQGCSQQDGLSKSPPHPTPKDW